MKVKVESIILTYLAVIYNNYDELLCIKKLHFVISQNIHIMFIHTVLLFLERDNVNDSMICTGI
jgi:hypothetical protein